MLYTVYFNNKRLVLAAAKDEIGNTELPGSPVVIDSPDEKAIKDLMDHMPGDTVVVIDKNTDRIWKMLDKYMTTVPAAGGLVTNTRQELLLIFRKGKWDLPKGKLDKGEDLETCALREVEEETGLSRLLLTNPLTTTYHTYLEKGKLILKESHWYLMHSAYPQVLVPQTDEDIEKCEWVPAHQLVPYLDNSHPSIVDVIRKGLKELNLAVS